MLICYKKSQIILKNLANTLEVFLLNIEMQEKKTH